MCDEETKTILLSPGPVYVDQSRWHGLETLHHRSAAFRSLVLETEKTIQGLLGTQSPVYLVTSSGTGVMEAALANVSRPGSRVLVVSGGKFGDRWEEISRILGCDTDVLCVPPDEEFDVGKIAKIAEKTRPDIICCTHVESSTGALLPLEELSGELREPRPLIVVDAIASCGAEELEMDAWHLDVIVGASQKAIGAPPGLGIISVGERAMELMRRCERPLYYFSLARYEEGREKGDTPFTPAVQIAQMVHDSLTRLAEIGWDTMRERHRRAAQALYHAAPSLSLGFLAAEPSSAVQAFTLPERCWDTGLVEELAEQERIIVADGQGLYKGRIIRTGFPGLYSGDTLGRFVVGVATALKNRGCVVDAKAAEEAKGALPLHSEIF
jgi:aspartate aminotransferase-like enzyme